MREDSPANLSYRPVLASADKCGGVFGGGAALILHPRLEGMGGTLAAASAPTSSRAPPPQRRRLLSPQAQQVGPAAMLPWS